MLQNVVAHFMTRDENDLWRIHLRDGRVPHDDAFGGAESGYVGVQPGGFLACAHPEHAFRRNVLAGALHHLLEARSQSGVFLLERFEFVEERIDNQRCHENNEEPDRKRDEPEIKPPPARAAADHYVQQPDQDDSNDVGDELTLGPIPCPGAPALYGETVNALHPFLINIGRKTEKRDGSEEEWRVDEGLDEAAG